jgi:hypothetical protein
MLLKVGVNRGGRFHAFRRAPGAYLLAGAGTALVASGLVLAWSHGAVLHLADPILVALAWCF